METVTKNIGNIKSGIYIYVPKDSGMYNANGESISIGIKIAKSKKQLEQDEFGKEWILMGKTFKNLRIKLIFNKKTKQTYYKDNEGKLEELPLAFKGKSKNSKLIPVTTEETFNELFNTSSNDVNLTRSIPTRETDIYTIKAEDVEKTPNMTANSEKILEEMLNQIEIWDKLFQRPKTSDINLVLLRDVKKNENKKRTSAVAETSIPPPIVKKVRFDDGELFNLGNPIESGHLPTSFQIDGL